MKTAHTALVDLLDKMRAARSRPAEFEALADQISILTSPYMTPVQGEEWVRFGLTEQQSRLACLLHTKLGKLVPHSALLDAMWFDAPDGGGSPKTLDVQIFKMRTALAGSYTIQNIMGRGFILHRVASERISEAA